MLDENGKRCKAELVRFDGGWVCQYCTLNKRWSEVDRATLQRMYEAGERRRPGENP